MEALLFGCGQELSTMTEITANMRLGVFEIRYSDRAPRSIGPRP